MVAMGEIWIDEFNDYRRGMRMLHNENKKIMAQLAALAERQEMQMKRIDLHNQYQSQLMQHGASFSHPDPPPPPPPQFQFLTWPPVIPACELCKSSNSNSKVESVKF